MAEPSFSIIIPTHNRPEQLGECLEAMANINYPIDSFEVIVVDDGSEAAPQSLVLSFSNRMKIKLITQFNAGPSAARNNGARNARGKYLAFTDDDCIPSPDWIKTFAKQFEKTPEAILGGLAVNKLTENLYSVASQLILEIVLNHFNADPQKATFLGAANIALSAKQFQAIEGFDETFRIASEDRDFCDRCLFKGFQMVYVPEAIVYHTHDLGFYTFVKQYFNHGCGAYYYQNKRARRGSGNMLEDTKFFLNLRNLLVYPFTKVKLLGAVPLSFLLATWQFANALGFLREAIKHTSRTIKP